MSPQEITLLAVAPIGHDGHPRCMRCAPIVGDRAPYFTNLHAAPSMAVDDEQPALCSCPTCGEKAQTPTILAVAILAERLRHA